MVIDKRSSFDQRRGGAPFYLIFLKEASSGSENGLKWSQGVDDRIIIERFNKILKDDKKSTDEILGRHEVAINSLRRR
ncbi:hypothetical protein [Desulfosporosinus sp. BG]|uniref:hypothetical protein n=1 Tax=Desulfosporosinus sp. BG TaxID=1633135 RepID=UPI00083AD84C|nr:hypothetical protein [Desulfosporosinus sp. BG]ODA40959.1 hypothetical protein DSBG_2262 [Desulfosporosinus sp. BG]